MFSIVNPMTPIQTLHGQWTVYLQGFDPSSELTEVLLCLNVIDRR